MCRIIRDLESGIGNANHGVERATVKLCVVDCVGDCIRLAIPERAVGQNVGDEIEAAMIFARADFVNVDRGLRWNAGLLKGKLVPDRVEFRMWHFQHITIRRAQAKTAERSFPQSIFQRIRSSSPQTFRD